MGTRIERKGFEARRRIGDIHVVTDGLSLGDRRLFVVTSALHVAAEQAESRVVRRDRAFSLLFDVHGILHVDCIGTHDSLSPDEVFLLSPDGRTPFTLSFEKGAEFYLLQFRQRRGPEISPRRVLSVPEHVALGNRGRLTHLMRMFMQEVRRAGSSMMLDHLLILMLCEMTHSSQVPARTRRHEENLESIASRVDAYVAAHYHEAIATLDIARELRYNPDYLERAYRAERRLSIRDAIHARRLREARAQLLLQRAARIAEVAAQCGYTDAAAFRRVFKRETRMTPQGYRMKNAPPAAAGHRHIRP